MHLKNVDENLFYLVRPGTNVRYTVNECVVAVDEEYVDEYVDQINNLMSLPYEKIPITTYHRKFSISAMIGTELDTDMYFFLVRIGTSERHINYSGDLNLCTEDHIERILPNLNKYGEIWEAVPIEAYYRTFGLVV
jgi:hypothetical protein